MKHKLLSDTGVHGRHLFVLVSIAFLAAGMLTTRPSLAATRTDVSPVCTVEWAVDADGDWDEPTKWSTGAVPTTTDDVCIDRPGVDVTVTVRDIHEANSLYASDAMAIASSGSLTLFQPSEITGDFTLNGGTLNAQGGLEFAGTSSLSERKL